jgi:hypothetical protein
MQSAGDLGSLVWKLDQINTNQNRRREYHKKTWRISRCYLRTTAHLQSPLYDVPPTLFHLFEELLEESSDSKERSVPNSICCHTAYKGRVLLARVKHSASVFIHTRARSPERLCALTIYMGHGKWTWGPARVRRLTWGYASIPSISWLYGAG